MEFFTSKPQAPAARQDIPKESPIARLPIPTVQPATMGPRGILAPKPTGQPKLEQAIQPQMVRSSEPSAEVVVRTLSENFNAAIVRMLEAHDRRVDEYVSSNRNLDTKVDRLAAMLEEVLELLRSAKVEAPAPKVQTHVDAEAPAEEEEPAEGEFAPVSKPAEESKDE